MRILIIKSSALGDILQSFPALAHLRTIYPDAEIDWVAESTYTDLLKAHPEVAEVIAISTRKWRKNIFRFSTWREILQVRRRLKAQSYDKVYDLQGNIKSAFFTWWARSKEKIGFDYKSVPEKPNLLATRRRVSVPADLPIQERYLRLVGAPSYVPSVVHLNLTPEEEAKLSALIPLVRPCYMVAMSSKWPNKQPTVDTLKGLLQKLPAHLLLIYSSPQEKMVADELHKLFPKSSRVIGDLSIPLWQALMRHVDLVLAVDSAALHLCALTKTPSFSLFGPTNPKVYKPCGDQHQYVQGPCPYGRTFVRRCPVLRTCPTGACVHNISADQIVAKLESR
ncbi:MAG: lipopolysaccharide heptosyltransferase I [Verrucomicrobia bacterium]|nr:lipopolysaccharide heptosyltransferase I [Verrucomicrobiota bacterium]